MRARMDQERSGGHSHRVAAGGDDITAATTESNEGVSDGEEHYKDFKSAQSSPAEGATQVEV